MSDPIKIKVLVKQVVTDPLGLNLPTLPSTAMVIGNAIGDKGNRTGVYGHSERSIAIYGESPAFAGYFEGDVCVSGELEAADTNILGNLTVTGNLSVRGRSINRQIEDLESQLQQLQERIAGLAEGFTDFGVPIDSPELRPSLGVRQLRREELAVNESPEIRHFEVQGSGFLRGTSTIVRFFNATSSDLNDIEGPNFPPRHSVVSDQSGKVMLRGEQVRCRVGDRLQVAASDGRKDKNDLSSRLWSNSVSLVVS